MPNEHKAKPEASAKTGETRRDRLAAELRSNLHKRKVRARHLETLQGQKSDRDKADG